MIFLFLLSVFFFTLQMIFVYTVKNDNKKSKVFLSTIVVVALENLLLYYNQWLNDTVLSIIQPNIESIILWIKTLKIDCIILHEIGIYDLLKNNKITLILIIIIISTIFMLFNSILSFLLSNIELKIINIILTIIWYPIYTFINLQISILIFTLNSFS